MIKRFLQTAIFLCLFTGFINTGCKNKKAETNTTTNTETTTPDNRVEINSDATLKQTVGDIVKNYEGVSADVNDGVVTLRGEINRDRLQPLIQAVNELKPKQVKNELKIKN